jgi:hypothetical protein
VVFWIVLGALVALWVVRLVLSKRALRGFCDGGCLTLALKEPGDRRWRHGYARLQGDALEWRAEYKFAPGPDKTFARGDVRVRDHRPVVRGEAMLSDRCEIVTALHHGEELLLAVVQGVDLDRFLDWAG